MAASFNIPQTALPIGQRIFTTANFAAISQGWNLTLNLVAWPASGDVMQVTVKSSQDNGATFQTEGSADFTAPQTDRKGNPVTSISVSSTKPTPGTTTMQFVLDVLQACTISGSGSAQ